MRGWVASLFVLAGCDIVWRIDRLPDAPPTDCIRDDFTGTAFADRWSRYNSNTAIQLYQADEIVIDFANAARLAGAAEAGVRLGGSYDMTGGSLEVEVTRVVGGTRELVEQYIRVRELNNNDDSYVIRFSAGLLGFWSRIGNVYERHVDRAYDPVKDRFWRIAHDAGTNRIAFAVKATNDAGWTTEIIVPLGASVADVQVLLMAGTYSGGDDNPGIASFDNFALCLTQPFTAP